MSYIGLPSLMSDFDIRTYKRMRSRYHAAVGSQPTSNVSLQLNTMEVKGFLFRTQTHMTWPRIAKADISFPLTQVRVREVVDCVFERLFLQVGNTTVRKVKLINPSSQPVWVQIVPLSLYPGWINLLEIVGNW